MANVKGQKRSEFAPYAEALRVTTDSVVSVQTDDSGATYTVLYTLRPTRNPNEMLYRALLWTNVESILEVVQNRPLCTLGRFAAQVRLVMGGLQVPIGKALREGPELH